MSGHNQSHLIFAMAQGTLLWYPILGIWGELTFIQCAGIR